MPNPYTLFSKILFEHKWFSAVDLKDAFLACPLDPKSRDLFVFEWENPTSGRKQQYCWIVLPQGFTEAPNLFGQILERVLEEFQCLTETQLLQYTSIGDLLISGEKKDKVSETTINRLNFLGKKGS